MNVRCSACGRHIGWPWWAYSWLGHAEGCVRDGREPDAYEDGTMPPPPEPLHVRLKQWWKVVRP
jgi:hypothetical protein